MSKIIICLDPGHGGTDRHNRGANGYVEADGVLMISKKLQQRLEETGHFKVYLTREDDSSYTLLERARFAKSVNADMFISEHTNAGGGSGVEVYYSVTKPKDVELAADFCSRIAGKFNAKNRGAKTRLYDKNEYVPRDYYGVMRNSIGSGVPHVFIIESLFHDDPAEEAILLTEQGIDLIVEAQFEALCNYYNVDTVSETETKYNELVSCIGDLAKAINNLAGKTEQLLRRIR